MQKNAVTTERFDLHTHDDRTFAATAQRFGRLSQVLSKYPRRQNVWSAATTERFCTFHTFCRRGHFRHLAGSNDRTFSPVATTERFQPPQQQNVFWHTHDDRTFSVFLPWLELSLFSRRRNVRTFSAKTKRSVVAALSARARAPTTSERFCGVAVSATTERFTLQCKRSVVAAQCFENETFCRRGQADVCADVQRRQNVLSCKKTFCRCGECKTFCRRGQQNVLSSRTTQTFCRRGHQNLWKRSVVVGIAC